MREAVGNARQHQGHEDQLDQIGTIVVDHACTGEGGMGSGTGGGWQLLELPRTGEIERQAKQQQ